MTSGSLHLFRMEEATKEERLCRLAVRLIRMYDYVVVSSSTECTVHAREVG